VLPLLKLGVAGKLGSGKQWWSWISLEDEVRLIVHALSTPDLAGPVNATAPNPATFAEVIKEAGRIAHRPTVLAVPKFALSLVMGGQMTEEVVLASQRALPRAAEASGFSFTHPDLASALRSVLEP
jgi:NAD dependent epimerase/dehydratase family enzyme